MCVLSVHRLIVYKLRLRVTIPTIMVVAFLSMRGEIFVKCEILKAIIVGVKSEVKFHKILKNDPAHPSQIIRNSHTSCRVGYL